MAILLIKRGRWMVFGVENKGNIFIASNLRQQNSIREEFVANLHLPPIINPLLKASTLWKPAEERTVLSLKQQFFYSCLDPKEYFNGKVFLLEQLPSGISLRKWNNISSCFWDIRISGHRHVWRSSLWEQVDDRHLTAHERALEKEFLRLSSLFIFTKHSITLRICMTRREKGKQNRNKIFLTVLLQSPTNTPFVFYPSWGLTLTVR